MAKGRKTGGRDFTKGHSLTPPGPGRPAVTPELKALRQINATELARILNALSTASIAELAEMSKDPTRSVLEMTIISIWKKAYEKGDQQRVNFILDRLVGKPKEMIEHTGEGFRVIIEDYLGKKKND